MNTNAKHTPGKWTTKIRQPGTMLTVENETGEYVCSLLGGDEHKQENARLIAAAPALLIELKNTVAAIEKWGKEHPESGGWIGVIHGALKAIAQAEGGAQ